MALYVDYVERDAKGMVRVPLLDLDEKGAKDLVEFIYTRTKSNQNFGYREKPDTHFGEYGKVKERKEARTNKKWSWADVEIILNNRLEDINTIAEMTGRTYMSIKHRVAEVTLAFDRWVSENASLCEGQTQEAQIELYREHGYELMSGDDNYG